MKSFITKPNLPAGPVTAAAVGAKYVRIARALVELGVEAINIGANMNVEGETSNHVDMNLLHFGGNRFAKTAGADAPIEGANFLFKTEISGRYPRDVPLNVCFVGKHLFANRKTADRRILNFAADNGLELVDVKQGYTKCSIAVVDEHSIITDDAAIAASCEKRSIDCLYIDERVVLLEGYAHGLLGGAFGKISDDTLVVTGKIKSRRVENKIVSFLKCRGVSLLTLTGGAAFDIGGILPLTEKIT